MKVIGISLPQYKNRRKSIYEELLKLNLDNCFIMDGVCGTDIKETNIVRTHHGVIKKLSYGDKVKRYDSRLRLNGTGLKKGEMGCAWSHLYIYEMLVNDDEHDSYLVLEDDAILDVSIEEFNTFLKELPEIKSFDLCHIFFSEWYPFRNLTQVNKYYWIPEKRFFNRTGAYIVTKSGAQKLLNASYPCMGLPSDDLISNTYIMSDNFRVIIPYKKLFKPLVVSSSISDINITPTDTSVETIIGDIKLTNIKNIKNI